MARVGRMHGSSLPATGQARLPHDTPDPFVVHLAAGTPQGFGHTTIAIADKGLTNFLDGSTQPLIAVLMRRWATMLIVPLSVDLQQVAELTRLRILASAPAASL